MQHAATRSDRSEFPQFFDTHTHLITNDYDSYPLNFAGQPVGGGKSRISLDELKARLETDPPTLENLRMWFGQMGVGGACGVQYKTAYGFNNTYLLDCIKQAPDLFCGVIVANLQDPETPDNIARLSQGHGITGVRATGLRDQETGAFSWIASPAAAKSIAAIAAHGLTLVLMPLPPRGMTPGEIGLVLELVAGIAKMHPGLRIVLDHVGWPELVGAPGFGLSPAHLALVGLPNVKFKFTTKSIAELTAAKIDPAQALRHFTTVFGADRMMWGSDVGNQPYDYATMIDMACQAGALLTQAERSAVFHDTGRACFTQVPHRSLAASVS